MKLINFYFCFSLQSTFGDFVANLFEKDRPSRLLDEVYDVRVDIFESVEYVNELKARMDEIDFKMIEYQNEIVFRPEKRIIYQESINKYLKERMEIVEIIDLQNNYQKSLSAMECEKKKKYEESI